ncbi:hypothetical protein GGH93_004196 [Coemansia aciculifera]|nr:hypothetical protein GGH93_004196 [Coemansia aciculifera]
MPFFVYFDSRISLGTGLSVLAQHVVLGAPLLALSCGQENAEVCGVADPRHLEYRVQPRTIMTSGEWARIS